MEKIIIKGARENNLKNISLELPRNKLIVFTGVSGSGKSTLAFDTIFAEGERKFMESLSSYARQFLGQMEKPDVDQIEGLSPCVAIDQKSTSHNPRSTVGTITEIYDYYRLLFANIGTPFCPNCNKPIAHQTIDQIVDKVMSFGLGTKIIITAPIIKGKKGAFQKEFESLKKSGYARVFVDGSIYDLDEEINLDKNKKHDINVVLDRIVLKEDSLSRLAESIEQALKLADGKVMIVKNDEPYIFSTNYACPTCGFSFEEISPRMFSFNAPYGACPDCSGLGVKKEISEKLVIGDENKSLNDGAMVVSGWNLDSGAMTKAYFNALSKKYGFSLDTPVKNLPKDIVNILLYGDSAGKIKIDYEGFGFQGSLTKNYEGIIPNLKRRYQTTSSDWTKAEIEKYMIETNCETCNGTRLKPEILCIKIGGKNIDEICNMPVIDELEFFDKLNLNETQEKIAKSILKEINARLNFLKNVGLGYLTLARTSSSLSGGESQRIRLATQIGSGLVGVIYILDEPSIGLHQRDNVKLIDTLKKLRDLGNTVIVVEHDEDTMLEADHIVDVGPNAGVHGGEIVAQGTANDIIKNKNSITGKYLSGEYKIDVPNKRRKPRGFIKITGAKEHNLKNITAEFPIGTLTCVTGVSGSGKSSLVTNILLPALSNKLNKTKYVEGDYKAIEGYEDITNVISIDQSPIGRTPRSNPATYVGVFTAIRELFAKTQTASERGYNASRFSFNVKGGRCEACSGDGIKKIEMYFLPDVFVPCEVCHGKRYNRETLEVKYKGKSIYDVLEMTIEEALMFFANIPTIKNKLQALFDVGLGYIKLGQTATTLSGGEAQRVKLATELCKKSTGKTLYILDEPTTGLHFADVDKLIKILQRIVSENNTCVVIEHNLDVIKVADYIIDIGPEGGAAGGTIVATGSPEEVAKNPKSITGEFIKQKLN